MKINKVLFYFQSEILIPPEILDILNVGRMEIEKMIKLDTPW